MTTTAWLALAGARVDLGPTPTNQECGYEECGCCGADLGKSADWVWHYPWEDCRAVREPINNQEVRR